MKKSLLTKAITVAKTAHDGQFRKSKFETKYPYFNHPEMVAKFVSYFGGDETDMIVAYLHDVVEDCADKGFDLSYIQNEFGEDIAKRVDELTNKYVDPMTGLAISKKEWKAKKKEIQIYHIKRMEKGNQLVKACDQISNIFDFVTLEPKDSLEKRRRFIDKSFGVAFSADKLSDDIKNYLESLSRIFEEFLYLEETGYFGDDLDKHRLKLRESWLQRFYNLPKLK